MPILSKTTADELARNWQRCRPEDLPGAFFAYDEEEEQSERVVTYALDAEALQTLADSVKKPDDFNFIVHLGLRYPHNSDLIPDQPAFVLMIEAITSKRQLRKQCLELSWVKNGTFSDSSNTNSGDNAISAAAAYLFIHSWMELHEADLAAPFTAVSRVLGKRVKSYRFSKIESESIYLDIKSSLESDAPGLEIHLGNGLAVWSHPFSFRPVVEVKKAVSPGNDRPMRRNSSGFTNGPGDSSYDYAVPDPPG